MLQFAHPWLFAVLPLPILARWLLPAHVTPRAAVRGPFFADLARMTDRPPSKGAVILQRNVGQRILLPLVWVLVVLALARPQWVDDPIEKIESARDLMLIVDLSVSMETRDFVGADGERIDRLSAVKDVLREFAAARETDRLGLVVFGQAAFVQVPFTLDHDLFLGLLDELETGMAGPRTMLGDAMAVAIRAFESSEADDRLAILLTDGNDTESKVPPPKAAELAAEREVTLYTIGVGDPEAAGEAPLDVETLERMAEITGGAFYRAEDRASLESVYEAIDAAEPLEFDTLTYRPTHELAHWPIGAVVVSTLAYHLGLGGWGWAARLRRRRSA